MDLVETKGINLIHLTENKAVVNATEHHDKRGISWASEQLPAVFRVISGMLSYQTRPIFIDRTVHMVTDV